MPSRCRSGGKDGGIEQVEQPHDLAAPRRWISWASLASGPSPTDVGQGQPEQIAVGIGDADAGHLVAAAPRAPGRRRRPGERQRHEQVDSAVIRAGQAHGSSRQVQPRAAYHRGAGPCPRTRAITPRRYRARWAGRRRRHPRRWPAPPPCTSRRTGRCPTTCRSCGAFKRAVVVDLDHHLRDQARQLGVVQQAGGRRSSSGWMASWTWRGVFVALHVLVGGARRRRPVGRPLVLFLGRRWPAPGPAAAPAAGPWRSSCPRAWAPPWAAAARRRRRSGFSVSLITGSGRRGRGRLHDPGQPELLPRLAELHRLGDDQVPDRLRPRRRLALRLVRPGTASAPWISSGDQHAADDAPAAQRSKRVMYCSSASHVDARSLQGIGDHPQLVGARPAS